ncbi:hypothetical protein SAMN05444266_103110 [Chitinophaga jiangningensis]|uniref:DUF5977 domain-containing protein n=1 Tax=Chitinophaga jiangningensis TaxID=1419482 RepID=A0A1M7A3I0_9BACT|nr:DUF5977 domain-containing protein [Chitinophaga jiangningensis]SHL37264.1 hypothetical protein SAMN05444266_103110 [Chitinophaga jiangningensis]
MALPTPFTIAEGADSSDISKEDANALADIRLQTEGQAYADESGRCRFYAKLTYRDRGVYDSSTTIINHHYYFEDVSVSYYADAACTIPYDASGITTVNVNKYDRRVYYQYGSPTGIVDESNTQSTFPGSSGTGDLLFNNILYKEESSPKTDPSIIVSTLIVTFTLLPGDDYIIVN